MDATAASKRLVIRKFKLRNPGNGLNFDRKWRIMEESVLNIQQEQKTSVSFEELYGIVEDLCLNNYSGEMHTRLQALIRRYVEEQAHCLASSAQGMDPQDFLRVLNLAWGKFCAQMGMIRSVFLFLDRTYRTQNASIVSLWDSGLEAFRHHFFSSSSYDSLIASTTLKGLLSMIELERLATQIDRQLLKSIIRMLMSLQIYDSIFETEFLKSTQQMYEAEGRAKSQELEVDLYMKHVARRIREEEERIDYYLEFSTAKKLLAVVDQCFIANHADSIIARGAESLFQSDKVDDLTLMYNLLVRVKGGLNTLKNSFYEYITKHGRTMVADTQRDATLVHELMDFKSRLDNIISKSFKNNEKFVQAEKDAFSYFVNTRPQKPAELIAKYMDSKLRKGNKELSEDELDSLMDRVIVLFRFVQGKDVFEAYYKRDLARRLLMGRSASYDSEKSMLLKLKTECGGAFTQRLDRMFQDIEVSRTLMERFNERFNPRKGDKSLLDFNVMTLSKCFWHSLEEIVTFEIPAVLRDSFQQYAQFYGEIYSSRKLELVLAKSSGELYCNAFARKYTLIVSTIQICVLLFFNDRNECTVDEIVAAMHLDANRIIPTLNPLVKSRLLVLCREDGQEIALESAPTTTITDKSVLRLNADFSNKKTKIDLSRAAEGHRKPEDADKEESEEVQKVLDADRKYAIEATIVRIMKMRKTLKHQELIRECLAQLSARFIPRVPQIKQCIDRLIDQFYLKRSESDRETYEYQA